jgi:hypothetical protein
MWNNITDEDIEKADTDFGVGGEPPDVMKYAGEQSAVGSVNEYEQQSQW